MGTGTDSERFPTDRVLKADHRRSPEPDILRKPCRHVTNPEQSWIVLAQVVRPQGRKGEVLAEIYTDFPERFSQRQRLFLVSGSAQGPAREVRVESQWLHKGRVVLKFADVDSIAEAEKLRGLQVVTPREERMPLDGDAVYISDLLGARVIDVRPNPAEDAGDITGVEPEGVGPAMLTVRTPAGEERLIPFVKAYLKKIDLEAKRIEMELPENLMSMQAPAAAGERQSLHEDESE